MHSSIYTVLKKSFTTDFVEKKPKTKKEIKPLAKQGYNFVITGDFSVDDKNDITIKFTVEHLTTGITVVDAEVSGVKANDVAIFDLVDAISMKVAEAVKKPLPQLIKKKTSLKISKNKKVEKKKQKKKTLTLAQRFKRVCSRYKWNSYYGNFGFTSVSILGSYGRAVFIYEPLFGNPRPYTSRGKYYTYGKNNVIIYSSIIGGNNMKHYYKIINVKKDKIVLQVVKSPLFDNGLLVVFNARK